MIQKQFTLYLENRPGELAKITHQLAVAKVNIEGISVSASPDVGLVQLVVSDAVKTRRILTEDNVPYTVQDVAVLSLVNRPGSLSRIVVGLAKHGVNISYVYGTASDTPGSRSSMIISAPDLKKVEKVWKEIC